ncbi:TPA: hypothetical protein OVZ51_002570 [Staphylococcus aureus]|nr:hypothetical protein [Staphylococcus aureus]
MIAFLIVHGKSNQLDNEIQQAKIEQKKSEIYKNLYNGNVDKAIEGMKKDKHFDKEDLKKTFKKEKKYEQLISLDKKETPYVIERLYDQKNEKEIRELAYNFENNETLQLEKDIIDKEGTAFSTGSEGHYKEQNKRLAMVSAEEGYIETAEDINKKLKDSDVEKEINKGKIKQLKEEKDNTDDKDKKKELDKDIEKLEKKSK